MEIEFTDKKIVFNRVLSKLDEFLIDFVKVLNSADLKYVVVSGYVSIVFGRSRQTEDIDVLVEELSFEQFEKFWGVMQEEFECLNTDSSKDAYARYLKENIALRFSRKDMPLPNIEFKISQTAQDFESLNNSVTLILNGNAIRISPIELQIAYKMYLGSDKDLKDAKHLFDIFKDKLNMEKLKSFLRDFNIDENVVKEYLRDIYES